jgi:hypothetical protein
MKGRQLGFVWLAGVWACSLAPVDLGDPAKGLEQSEPGTDSGSDASADTTPPTTTTTTPVPDSGAAESVVAQSAVPEVATAQHLVVAGNRLYYDATVKGQRYGQHVIYCWDLTTKQNVGLSVPSADVPFAADDHGLFFGGHGIIPDQEPTNAIVGGPLGSGAFTPGWLSPADGTPTALALDATYVYWVESYDGYSNWYRAPRGSFAIHPAPTHWSTLAMVALGWELKVHMLVDNDRVFFGIDGALSRSDMAVGGDENVDLLPSGGPSDRFDGDDTNLYWVDATNAKLMRFAKSAGPFTSATVVASLPADSDNALGGIGGKGIYILSQPKAGGATGKVLRIDAKTGASADLATRLDQPREGVFAQGALYFVASQGIMRVVD